MKRYKSYLKELASIALIPHKIGSDKAKVQKSYKAKDRAEWDTVYSRVDMRRRHGNVYGFSGDPNKLTMTITYTSEKQRAEFEKLVGLDVNEMSAKKHYNKMVAQGKVGRGGRVVTPIDRDRFPNREREGLEGPFRSRKSGQIYYYDKKAGEYYDPQSDMYLSVDDVMESEASNSAFNFEDDDDSSSMIQEAYSGVNSLGSNSKIKKAYKSIFDFFTKTWYKSVSDGTKARVVGEDNKEVIEDYRHKVEDRLIAYVLQGFLQKGKPIDPDYLYTGLSGLNMEGTDAKATDAFKRNIGFENTMRRGLGSLKDKSDKNAHERQLEDLFEALVTAYIDATNKFIKEEGKVKLKLPPWDQEIIYDFDWEARRRGTPKWYKEWEYQK
jgi:hypothetical protein